MLSWCKISVFLCLLLCFSYPSLRVVGTPNCALYEPPIPGIRCFHGSGVLGAVTGSRQAWVVEMYSGWCGHCQNFAPRLKELAKEIEVWSDVIRVGVLECTESKDNQNTCTKLDVIAYPTIRFFRPLDPTPLEAKNAVVGGRSIEDLRRLMVDHVVSVTPVPPSWPDFSILVNKTVLEEDRASWMPSVFIFEAEDSYLGKELILDFSSFKSVMLRRVSNKNTAMVEHYSVLEFPSAVIELTKDHFHIISGHSVEDARSEFRGRLLGEIAGSDLDHNQQPMPSIPRTGRLHPQHYPLHHQTNRVELIDLLGAISYGLRAEVPLHAIISGSAYSALFNFVSLLEQGFSGVVPGGVAASLKAVRVRLQERRQAGFVTNKEWHRIMDSKLDSDLFPLHVKWKMCNGSRPHFRGYPCGLWMLMHTLTCLTLPVNHTSPQQTTPIITSTRALVVMIQFVRNFFSCEECRQHFSAMSRALSPRALLGSGDAILWLWEAHNVVNARMRVGGSGDPLHPKFLFPSISHCPYCYRRTDGMSHDLESVSPDFNNTRFVRGEGLLEGEGEEEELVPRRGSRSFLHAHQSSSVERDYVWNRTAVLLYLWNFYRLERGHGNGTKSGMKQNHKDSQSAILQAAWPRKFLSKRYRLEWKRGDSPDPSPCLGPFAVCGVFVVALVFWMCRKRRCRRFFH